MILYRRKKIVVPRDAWVVFWLSSTIITSDSFLSVALLQIDQFRLFELIEGISEHKTPENGPKTHHAMIYDHFPAIHHGPCPQFAQKRVKTSQINQPKCTMGNSLIACDRS